MYYTGLNHAQEELFYALDGKEYCAFSAFTIQDDKSWYKRKFEEKKNLKARCTFFRCVEHQFRILRVKRFEDGGESDIRLPHSQDIENGRMRWFFLDVNGHRRCLATGML